MRSVVSTPTLARMVGRHRTYVLRIAKERGIGSRNSSGRYVFDEQAVIDMREEIGRRSQTRFTTETPLRKIARAAEKKSL